MATTFRTPGVYIQEIPKFPPSVVPVETAIPCFIGYTEKAKKTADDDLIGKAQKIFGPEEYLLYYGGPDDSIELNVKIEERVNQATDVLERTIVPVQPQPSALKYMMAYCVRMFFANGGGPCYIISVGKYSENPIDKDELGTKPDGTGGLDILEKEDEPTLIVFPDLQGLGTDSQFYAVYQAALSQCNKLKDRFTIIDTRGDAQDAPKNLRDTLSSDYYNYGAVYYPFLETVLNYTYKDENVSIEHTSERTLATTNALRILQGFTRELDSNQSSLSNARARLLNLAGKFNPLADDDSKLTLKRPELQNLLQELKVIVDDAKAEGNAVKDLANAVKEAVDDNALKAEIDGLVTGALQDAINAFSAPTDYPADINNQIAAVTAANPDVKAIATATRDIVDGVTSNDLLPNLANAIDDLITPLGNATDATTGTIKGEVDQVVNTEYPAALANFENTEKKSLKDKIEEIRAPGTDASGLGGDLKTEIDALVAKVRGDLFDAVKKLIPKATQAQNVDSSIETAKNELNSLITIEAGSGLETLLSDLTTDGTEAVDPAVTSNDIKTIADDTSTKLTELEAILDDILARAEELAANIITIFQPSQGKVQESFDTVTALRGGLETNETAIKNLDLEVNGFSDNVVDVKASELGTETNSFISQLDGVVEKIGNLEDSAGTASGALSDTEDPGSATRNQITNALNPIAGAKTAISTLKSDLETNRDNLAGAGNTGARRTAAGQIVTTIENTNLQNQIRALLNSEQALTRALENAQSKDEDGHLNGKKLSDDEIKKANNQIYNEIKAAIQNDVRVKLPPSSTMAGIYARVDNDRGVWKAPANVAVQSVVGPTVKVNNDIQDGLNVDPEGGKSINVIRAFAGQGTLVWGSRTLDGNDNEWRFVPVRRFFIFAEESIKKATRQFVFEPNDARTWIKVKAMIENFLTLQWRAGALAGPAPVAAFYVKVGLGETMSNIDILEGRMNVEIGMAVVRPAEFIILKFSHKMQEA